MQITMIAGGSRGDVQPYVALGKGLQEAGHIVRILTTDDFQTLVTDNGLDFFTTGGSAEAVAQEMQTRLEEGKMLKILADMRRASEKQAGQAAEKGLIACQGSDLILGGLSGLFSGQALSEKLDIPLLLAYLVPFTPTSAFPSTLTPVPQTPLTHWMNKPSHRVAQQIMWQSLRSTDSKARAEVLHISPASFWGPFSSLRRQKRPVLYGYSSQVLPSPKDWDPSQHVTGYWFLEPPQGWEPPADLVQFLQAGPPPIYIGFGSMSSRKPEEAADMVLEALARTGQRGVLYEGWGGLKKEQVPETVFMTRSIPHTWLFPRMAAVVHHGGVGTTAAGLAAGVPSIVTPFFADQPFWGQRVYELGVGPRPIPRKRLTIDNLTEAIEHAVSDEEMRKRASLLGERIRAENGIAQAVTIIEQMKGSLLGI
ncbi:MAG TPA: glycosyltransferase [Ktedonobacteraceae bacterium]